MKSASILISVVLAFAAIKALAGLEDIPNNLKPIPEWSEKSAIVLTSGRLKDSQSPFYKEWLNLIQILATNSGINVMVYGPTDYELGLLKRELGSLPALTILENAEHSSKWVRDYAPFWLRDKAANDFVLIDLPYPRPDKDDKFPVKFAKDLGLNLIVPNVGSVSYALAGGNFQPDDEGHCFLTGLDSQRWMKEFNELITKFGCQTNVFLEALPGEPTSHVDMFFMALPNRVALVSYYGDPADQEIQTVMERNYSVLEQQGYRLLKLPTKHNGIDHYSYTNSVIIGKKAFVPQYGIETDEQAISIYESAGFETFKVPAANMIHFHGSVHCMTSYVFK